MLKNKLLLTLLLAATAATVSTTAQAREVHLLDLGFKGDLGLGGNFNQNLGHRMQSFAQIGARLDILYVFAIDLEYKPVEFTTSSNSLDARWRASALLYLVTAPAFDVYLKGGVGATSFHRLLSSPIGAPTATLHAGIGFDVQLTPQMSVGLETLIVSMSEPQIVQSYDYNGTANLTPYTFSTTAGIRYFLF
jgi:hypothetical protein